MFALVDFKIKLPGNVGLECREISKLELWI